ncbi:N-acetylglucosamine-6-phosphate deacetylase [Rossellomorea arthrocnemi]|uniref:N-acetylglucosamine-6-phosphate deacetylase n=1 Tax=Rossellomorea arthrocnemi TaxID=2769542 RepID=UPI00191A1F61|nr:N-acetylglucosamine-6-phosphate deacetylase [Rossellomorea arthrocnemi]
MKALKADYIYTPEGIVENGYLLLEDGYISGVSDETPPCDIIDFPGCAAIPGMIDLHIHGIAGHDTMDGSVLSLQEMSNSLVKYGVTGFLPTTLTHDLESIQKAVGAVSTAIGQTTGAEILGSYVEGPYITPDHKGAHPVDYMRELSIEEMEGLINASDNTIKVLTIAPEKEHAMEVIDYLMGKGIHVSMGHTNADYETTNLAVSHGARIAVHTFNGMRGFKHRDPGCVGAVLTNDDCFCECIADLHHLHPGAIKLLYKTKGSDKILLISDSMAAADLPDGHYTLGILDVKVKDRIARTVETNSLAGSTTNLLDCLKNMKEVLKLPLEGILPMVSLNQAKLLKIDHEVGSLEIGKKANIVLIDDKWDVRATFVGGEMVWGGGRGTVSQPENSSPKKGFIGPS